MEYWEGTTLRDDLRSKQFRPGMTSADAESWCKDTIGLIEQCFSGIHQIHQKQIKHLDIKPSNIFITRYPNGGLLGAKILDFGLAAHGRISSIRGTPHYMSPEQVAGEELTEASDVFSMGVVAYELLTRQHPFSDTDALDQPDVLARNIREAIPQYIKELNPHVPDSVAWVVHKTLAKDPDERPNSEQVHELINLFKRFQHRTCSPWAGNSSPSGRKSYWRENFPGLRAIYPFWNDRAGLSRNLFSFARSHHSCRL